MIAITAWQRPVAVTVVGTTLGGHDARDCIDLDRPMRGWRGSALPNIGIVYDLGSSQTVRGVVVDHVNTALVQLGYSDDGSTWTTTTYNVVLDGYSNRRKLWVDYGATGIARRYWRILCASSSADDGTAIAYIGSVGLARTRVASAYGTPRLSYAIDATRIIDGLRPRATSRYAVMLELGGGRMPASELTVWQALAHARGEPVAVIVGSTPYIGRIMEPVRIDVTAGTLIDIGRVVVREVR